MEKLITGDKSWLVMQIEEEESWARESGISESAVN
jgi:hypothetical protein